MEIFEAYYYIVNGPNPVGNLSDWVEYLPEHDPLHIWAIKEFATILGEYLRECLSCNCIIEDIFPMVKI
jgi:hypothetical protein